MFLGNDVFSEDIKKLMEAATVTRCQVYITCLTGLYVCVYVGD